MKDMQGKHITVNCWNDWFDHPAKMVLELYDNKNYDNTVFILGSYCFKDCNDLKTRYDGKKLIISILRTIKSANSDALKYILMTGIIGLSYFGIVTVVFNLYLLRLGYDTRFIGLTNACMPIAFALSGIISGILGRKWGSKGNL